MLQASVLAFLVGLFAANGIPHFVSGITNKTFPCQLGDGPIPNLIGGWGSFVIAALLLRLAPFGEFPDLSQASAAFGALLIGLFHAAGGASWLRRTLRRTA